MRPYHQPILMYHAVARAEEDPNRLCISPRRFEAHMSYLKRRGLHGVSVGELRRARGRQASRLVGLTFDDGYENFLREATPIMERHGFSATVFAVSGRVGGENEWEHAYEPRPPMELLDAEGLREAAERGMEIGSHTVSHARLAGLDADLLRKEVEDSRRALGELLGREIEGFCYPYGSLDPAAIKAVRSAGYSYACAWKVQFERSSYDLFRTPLDEQDGVWRLAAKLRIYPQYTALTRRFG